MSLDPDPYTLGELEWMFDAWMRAQWMHTSAMLAMLYNIHRGKRAAKSPEKFDPTAMGRSRRRPAAVPIASKEQQRKILKAVFCGQ